ncbi:MAG: TIGR01777 family oxidoreductase [Flavobacteriales bacterium]
MAIFTITGATGSVGQAIVNQLLEENHSVRVLSTRKGLTMDGIEVYSWNTDHGTIDLAALEGADHLIHLAGATVNKRWTPKYKQAIMDSRVQGTQLLIDALQKINKGPSSVVSASAIGIYGSDFNNELTETSPAADDFLAAVTKIWESYTQKFESNNCRSVQLRIGIVLDQGAGVLGQLEPFVKWGIASPLGSGKQWTSWIHVEDLARMFLFAATQAIPSGPYNAVGPEPLTNKVFTKQLCRALHRPMLFPAVPGFALKLIFGEMATLALMSQKVSPAKITGTGFTFHYTTAVQALEQIYGN